MNIKVNTVTIYLKYDFQYAVTIIIAYCFRYIIFEVMPYDGKAIHGHTSG